MSYKTNLMFAYHMGYDDALAHKMPYADKVAVLNEDTCKADKTETWQGVCMMSKPIRYVRNLTIHVMECSECGGTYEHVNGGYEYCPRCGKKVVDE